MVSEARLLECFNEAKSPILAEEELRAWWEKERDSMQQQQLSDSLRVLVEEEKLGERSVCVGDSQTKVYWIKNQVPATATPPAVLTATPLIPSRVGKRSRFTSPLLQDSREKRVKLSVALDTVKSSSELDSKNDPSNETMEERKVLLSQIKESKEELRKLKMVKMYRTKTDVQGLDMLIQQWREVCQEAAQSVLNSSTHQPRPSMDQLLNHLHIEPELIHYSLDDESFY